MADPRSPFVSRAGVKLAAALDAFDANVAGFCCADLGCNIGGFTDCLIQRGASKVYAVDTGYGVLAWPLRQNPRVVVLERTNVLHMDPCQIEGFSGCDLVVIDLGWTRQVHAIPTALCWLKPDRSSRIMTLIKPQYEAEPNALRRGVLSDEIAAEVTQRVLERISSLGVRVIGHLRSPVRGGASRRRNGNIEYLAMLARL